MSVSSSAWFSHACFDKDADAATAKTTKTANTDKTLVAHAVFAKASLLWPNGTVRFFFFQTKYDQTENTQFLGP